MSSPFVITRLFDAPIHRLYAAWTEKEMLEKWMSPAGSTMEILTYELREGGRIHYRQVDEEGKEQYGLWVFEKLDAPKSFVSVSSFSDADGGLTRHPLAADWPLKVRTVYMLEEQDGKTLLTMTSEPVEATAEERALFEGSSSAMEGGWAGTFEQLEQFLQS